MITGIGDGAEVSRNMQLINSKTLQSGIYDPDDLRMLKEADRSGKKNKLKPRFIKASPDDQYYWGEKCRVKGCSRDANVGWGGEELSRDKNFPHAVSDPFYVCWHHIKLHTDRRYRWDLRHQDIDETARTRVKARTCPQCNTELKFRQRLCDKCGRKNRLKTRKISQKKYRVKNRG